MGWDIGVHFIQQIQSKQKCKHWETPQAKHPVLLKRFETFIMHEEFVVCMLDLVQLWPEQYRPMLQFFTSTTLSVVKCYARKDSSVFGVQKVLRDAREREERERERERTGWGGGVYLYFEFLLSVIPVHMFIYFKKQRSLR